jgi:hypothetical protein
MEKIKKAVSWFMTQDQVSFKLTQQCNENIINGNASLAGEKRNEKILYKKLQDAIRTGKDEEIQRRNAVEIERSQQRQVVIERNLLKFSTLKHNVQSLLSEVEFEKNSSLSNVAIHGLERIAIDNRNISSNTSLERLEEIINANNQVFDDEQVTKEEIQEKIQENNIARQVEDNINTILEKARVSVERDTKSNNTNKVLINNNNTNKVPIDNNPPTSSPILKKSQNTYISNQQRRKITIKKSNS